MIPGRFPLPEGFGWRDVEDRDRAWLSDYSHRGTVIGIIMIHVRLRNMETGEERDVHYSNAGLAVWDTELARRGEDGIIDGIVFHWTDGNYGCGCNRTIFWHEAAGEPVPEEHPCDAPFRISWPDWLADYDREPYYGEPRPWKKCSVCGGERALDEACKNCGAEA